MVKIKFFGFKQGYEYIGTLLNALIREFDRYDFVVCTDSPIEELQYCFFKDMYFRKYAEKEDVRQLYDVAEYEKSYNADHVELTFEDYLSLCSLHELNEICMVPKFFELQKAVQDLKETSVARIEICPDGLCEIHVFAALKIAEKIRTIAENL